ncbi:MAG: hypothetical protein PHR10_10880 [Sphaerochaetaceae bacterium]|nr:hypothetical protein [Sphaerochaetaceae bacterium]
MPRRDGKGPLGGNGPGRGLGRGRGKSGDAMGPEGNCFCRTCNYHLPHQTGVACTDMVCPQCGKPMVREDLSEK